MKFSDKVCYVVNFGINTTMCWDLFSWKWQGRRSRIYCWFRNIYELVIWWNHENGNKFLRLITYSIYNRDWEINAIVQGTGRSHLWNTTYNSAELSLRKMQRRAFEMTKGMQSLFRKSQLKELAFFNLDKQNLRRVTISLY